MDDDNRSVEQIAEHASAGDLTIAVAESLTGGELAARLAAGPDAATWFAGGAVTYTAEVKQRVLGVPPGPVVSETTARAMADGVADLFGADVAVAVTGVGGPTAQEGEPPGTVWWAVHSGDRTEAGCVHLPGDPREVVAATIEMSLARLLAALRAAAAP